MEETAKDTYFLSAWAAEHGCSAAFTGGSARESFSRERGLSPLGGGDWDIVNADCYGLSLSLLTVELQMSMLFF